MRGEDLYNLFDAHLYILCEQGFYKNLKYEDLTPLEKQWYDKVGSLVDLKNQKETRQMIMYRIMGYRAEPIETNDISAPTTPREEIVIYETDDREEMRKIMSFGGFIDSNDVYFPASRVVTYKTVGSVNTDESSGVETGASLRKEGDTLKKGQV